MAEVRELLAAATPRPWVLEDSPSRSVIYGGIRPGVTRTVVSDIDTSWESDAAAAEAGADAQLIVAAVNEYEALLAIEGHVREMFAGWHPSSKSLQLLERLDEVRRG